MHSKREPTIEDVVGTRSRTVKTCVQNSKSGNQTGKDRNVENVGNVEIWKYGNVENVEMLEMWKIPPRENTTRENTDIHP